MVRTSSQKYRGYIAIAVGILAVVGLFVMVTLQFVKKDDSVSSGHDSVAIEGAVVCLPHKDTSGPQTLECAVGIKDTKGKHYALKDTDSSYRNIQTLPTGKNVRVHGTLSASLDTRYDTAGTIEVSSIDEL